jgi:putative hydrolase of the HAD superfamily
MNVDWIFFDVGSTLVDETLAYDHRAIDMIKNTTITFFEFDKMRRELSQLGYDGNSEAIKRLGLEKTPWHTEYEVLYGNVIPVLKVLMKSGYNLGIIANQQPGLKQRLESFDILKYFSIIISSSDVGLSKPDKNIFKMAVSRAKSSAEKCLMVGDRLDNDIIPASRVGMKTIWIKNGLSILQSDKLGSRFANYIIYDLKEILKILELE